MSEPDPEVFEAPGPMEASVVPSYWVRNCMVCGMPMEGRKCKCVCRSCGA
jgi:hypothetical protein